MRNFLRAVRCAWPYRRRLILSFLAALCAAVLWSLNFTAIYPVLKILGNEQSLQEWVDDRIDQTQKDIDRWQAEVDVYSREQKAIEDLPRSKLKDRRENELANSLAKLEGKLAPARNTQYYLQIARTYIYKLLPTEPFQTLAWVIGMVVLAVAVKGFFEFWQESLVGNVVNMSLFDLRNRFYRNVIHLDVNDFGDDGTHELMARFTNDVEMLGAGLKTLFGKVIAEPLKAIACVVWAMWISWQLTLMFLVLVPVALFVLTKVGQLMKRATRRLLERMSYIYKHLQETFQGIRIVQGFTGEAWERRRFRSATLDYYYKAMQVVNLDALASPIIELLGVAAIGLALLAGAYLVLQKQTHLFGMRMTTTPMEVESLLTLYAFLAAIADPVRKLSSVFTRIQSGEAAANRIFDYIDRQPRVRVNSSGPRLGRHNAAIEFREVCFRYEPGKDILTNINLKIRFGETVALVGKNGCGKTTLLGMIPRFYDPDHGAVLIDGQDIRHVHLRGLRQQVGAVTQSTILFDDTIYNNIAYGKRRARPEEIEEAAKRSFAHDIILRQPNGYETRIGESGFRMSGGERQRISLARAILRNPSIFILDEFTSAIDAEDEALIHRDLREFMRGRTTLVITHRLNTLEIADRIVVLDNGRIEAVGTHAELLRCCATYQRLHEAQSQQKRCA